MINLELEYTSVPAMETLRKDDHEEGHKNFDNKSNNYGRNKEHTTGKDSEEPYCNDSVAIVLARARKLLYVSHLFSQFSEVTWQFCLILFLAAFCNYESLILVSTYGLISELGVCCFGSTFGRFIDGTNRLVVAQRFIWSENVAVLAATFCCYLLFKNGKFEENEPNHYDGEDELNLQQRFQGIPTDPWSLFLLSAIHVLGATANILDQGFVVAIERDWIVVMSHFAVKARSTPTQGEEEGQIDNAAEQKKPLSETNVTLTATRGEEGVTDDDVQKKWLSETNVTMTQIDLSCKVVAPAVAGFIVALFDDEEHHDRDLRGATILVGIINVMALIVEYICTAMIYNQIPDLANKLMQQDSSENFEDGIDDNSVSDIVDEAASDVEVEKTSNASKPNVNESAVEKGYWKSLCRLRLPNGLQVYMDQAVSWAGVALALLYANVLTFGGFMTAYLVWRGMRLETIGVWSGISAALGLGGTFAYHLSSKYLSLVATGSWSILFQFCCLSLSYASLFVEDYNSSLGMLIAGVCASRVGLWVFDISVTQMMQMYIPDNVRGLVGGVQQSLNSFFLLLSFLLGIIIPDPRNFHLFVAVGYISVGVAAVCYMFGVYCRREKIFGSDNQLMSSNF